MENDRKTMLVLEDSPLSGCAIDTTKTLIRAEAPLLGLPSALDALRDYLRRLRATGRDPRLMHDGYPTYDEVARDAGVPTVTLFDARGALESGAVENLAVELNANALELATRDPAVVTDQGALHVLTPAQASYLAQTGNVRPRMVPKLKAAVRALGKGLRLVRIGSPMSLDSDEATQVRNGHPYLEPRLGPLEPIRRRTSVVAA